MAGGSGDRANAVALLSDQRRTSRSPRFAGGTLVAVLADLALDLRDALPAPAGARLRVVAVGGDVEVVVPRGWAVELGPVSILGDVADRTVAAESAGEAPRLGVGGFVLFGEVVVRHPG